jgi:hypothetical protein
VAGELRLGGRFLQRGEEKAGDAHEVVFAGKM